MGKSVNLCTLSFYDFRAWILAGVFVVGNIALPQLAHLVPQGGPILLPIYFFTLIAAYKYGLWVGLATALLSPAAGHLLFGMPAESALAVILVKGTLLALAAALAARWTGRVSLIAITCAVISYQLLGGVFEWIVTGSFAAALADFTIGAPGILLQIVGGWVILKIAR